jgi:hypothetical protein
MGGGPSKEQKAAARSQEQANAQNAATQREMLGIYKDQFKKIEPFETERMKNGLPFFNALTDFSSGTNAQAFAPARAQLLRRLGGQSLPSGFREAALTDFEGDRSRAFDSSLRENLLIQEQAKNNAAQALTGQQQLANPLGWSQAVTQGNNAVMNAPLAKPGIAGLLGGVAGGVGAAMF